MVEVTTWPRKTRELRHRIVDSRIWNIFEFRDDDIAIATYGKSGTTWMQQIVGQLLFGGNPDLEVPELSPWLDLRFDQADKLAKHWNDNLRRDLHETVSVYAGEDFYTIFVDELDSSLLFEQEVA